MKAESRHDLIADCVKSLTSKPDFPAFSKHVRSILTTVEDEDASFRELTSFIVRDYGLTMKLLRTANSARYNLSGRPILSVSRALLVLGTEAVRHIATSLLIFEHFHKKLAGVRGLMILSLLTANHVRDLVSRFPSLKMEEAYLCGMVRNLGEVLVAYYLPEQYARILQAVELRGQTVAAASLSLLHFTFEDLGEAISQYWCMPDRVVQCQRAQLPPAGVKADPDGLLLAAVSLGHLVTTAVYRMEPEIGAIRLKNGLRDHRSVLPMAQKDVEQMLQKAIAETRESFSLMGVHINDLRLQAQTRVALEGLSETTQEDGKTLDLIDRDDLRLQADDTLERLTKEVCALVDSRAPTELTPLILMVLEAAYRGGEFDRVLFAFVNVDRTYIEARTGLGEDVEKLIQSFRFRMSIGGGPVPRALLCKRSVVVNTGFDTTNEIAVLFDCAYFGLYPVVVAHQVVGCIYAENRRPRSALSSTRLELLEDLRSALTTAMVRLSVQAEATLQRT